MTIITTVKAGLYSFSAKRKFGKPNQFGAIVPGITQFGDDNDKAGIYQQYHCRNGVKTVKKKFYWPAQNPSTAQSASQAKFAEAVHMWQNFTNEQRQFWRNRAMYQPISGYTLFIRYHMQH